MKKMNKVIASLLAGSMVFSLAACGAQKSQQSAAPSSSAQGGQSAEASTPAAPAEIVKPESIKVMWDGTVFKEGDNYAKQFYEALDKALGLHVEWIRPDHSTYSEQVGIAFNDQSTLADVVILPSNYYASYAAQGNLWNMTEAWNNSETVKSGRLTDVADQIIKGWYVPGADGQEGIYGMYPARGNGCVTFVRAEWAKKAGYDSADKLPTDWAGYQEFLKKMKAANDGKAPVLAAGLINIKEAPYTNYLPEFYQDAYPEFYKDASGKWVDGFSEPAMAAALDRLAWGYKEGVLEASILENPSTADVRNKFYGGTTGVFTYWAGTWAYNLKSNLEKNKLDGECWPMKPIKETGSYIERLSPMLAITSACKNPEGVFKYFVDPILDGGEVQMLWQYGVEGVHYEWDAEKKTIKGLPTEVTANSDKKALTTKNLFEANLKLANFSGTDPYVAADPVIDESFKLFNENSKPAPAVNSSEIYRQQVSALNDKKSILVSKVTKGEMTGQQAIDEYKKDCGPIVEAILADFNQ